MQNVCILEEKDEAIRQEFAGAVRINNWQEIHAFELESRQLLEAALDNDEAFVAERIAATSNT